MAVGQKLELTERDEAWLDLVLKALQLRIESKLDILEGASITDKIKETRETLLSLIPELHEFADTEHVLRAALEIILKKGKKTLLNRELFTATIKQSLKKELVRRQVHRLFEGNDPLCNNDDILDSLLDSLGVEPSAEEKEILRKIYHILKNKKQGEGDLKEIIEFFYVKAKNTAMRFVLLQKKLRELESLGE